jgi:hypothetical protein
MTQRWTDEELDALEHDPDMWDLDTPVEVESRPLDGLRITFDLSREDVQVLSRAAAAQGMPLHRYMRAAALEKAAASRAVSVGESG